MYLVHALLYCSLIVCALKNLHSNISSTRNVKISKRSHEDFRHGDERFWTVKNLNFMIILLPVNFSGLEGWFPGQKFWKITKNFYAILYCARTRIEFCSDSTSLSTYKWIFIWITITFRLHFKLRWVRFRLRRDWRLRNKFKWFDKNLSLLSKLLNSRKWIWMKIPKNDEPAEILSSNTFEVNTL